MVRLVVVVLTMLVGPPLEGMWKTLLLITFQIRLIRFPLILPLWLIFPLFLFVILNISLFV